MHISFYDFLFMISFGLGFSPFLILSIFILFKTVKQQKQLISHDGFRIIQSIGEVLPMIGVLRNHRSQIADLAMMVSHLPKLKN